MVPQKVNKDQKANDKNAQNWRVVQNFQPLNAQVVTEANALPLVEDVIAIAEGKRIFSLVDMSKAFFKSRRTRARILVYPISQRNC